MLGLQIKEPVQFLRINNPNKSDLEINRERYGFILDNLLEGCQIIGFDWRYLYLNDAAVRQSRKTKRQLLGRTIMKVYTGIEDTKMFNHLNLCMKDRVSTKIESEFTYPDNSKAWFELKIVPLPEGILILSFDITTRKLAEEAQSRAESKYLALIENSPIGISIVQDGEIVFANKRVEAMTGYSIEELKMVDGFSLIHEADRETMPNNLILYSNKFCFTHKDGWICWLERHVTSIEWNSKPAFLVMDNDITEEKQSEDALKEVYQLFDNVANNSTALVWISDTQKRCTWFNKPWLRFTGRTMDQELDNGWAEGIHPDDLGKCLKIYTEAFDKRDLFAMEYRLRYNDGSYRWVYDSGTPMYDSKGKFAGYVGSCLDITDIKKAEEQISFQAKLLDEQTDAVVVLGNGGNLTYVNRAACAIHGYTREELLKMSIDQLVSDKSKIMPSSMNTLFSNGLATYEVTHRKKDGTEFPMEIHAVVTSINGRKQIMSVAHDITDFKKREAALLFRAQLLDSAMDSIYVIDDRGNLVYFNKAAYISRGYTREEMTNKHLSDLISPDFFPSLSMKLNKVMEEKGEATIETTAMRKDQSKFPVEIHTKMITVEDKEYLVNISRNISQRKESQDKLRLQAQLLDAQMDAVYVHDKAGNLLYINTAACAAQGYTREEMMKMTIYQMDTPEAASAIPKRKIIVEEKCLNIFEMEHIRKDGSTYPVEVHSIVTAWNGQDIVFSVARDITERKKTEEDLRFQSQLLNSVSESVYVWDTQNRLVYVNNASCLSSDYSREELLGKHISDLLPADEIEKTVKQTNLKLSESGQNTIESIALHRTKHDIPVEVHSCLIKLGGQNYTVSIESDITERKAAEVRLKQSYAQLQQTLRGITQALAATVELRDPYTAGHQLHVAQLAQAIATEMGLAGDESNQIYTAGLIHDIGKISIPAEILSKPGILSDLEYALIKMHAQAGYEIMKTIKFPYPIASWILEHHELLDGSGYPSGLKGENISKAARILTVADVVEAMASHRPYRASLGMEKALKEINTNKNKLYDGEVVSACLRLINEKGFKFN